MACSIPDTLGTGCRRTETRRGRAAGVTGHLPLPVLTGRPSCACSTTCMVMAPGRLAPDCDLKLALWGSLRVSLLFLKRKKKIQEYFPLYSNSCECMEGVPSRAARSGCCQLLKDTRDGRVSVLPSPPASASSVREDPWEGFWKAVYGSRRIEHFPRIRVFNFKIGL